MKSPYAGKDKLEWKSITEVLVENHPLNKQDIHDIAVKSWSLLWETKIGKIISVREAGLSAQVIGNFFQKIFTHQLENKFKDDWRGDSYKKDKDLVYIKDINFSVEMKSSGQPGYELYGNRCTSLDVNKKSSGKDKSGYYITVNFIGDKLTLLRFGWIDNDDWQPQKSPTGHAATLDKDVYKYKLIDINGSYRNNTPIMLCAGIGEATEEYCNKHHVFTFQDLRGYIGNDEKIAKLRDKNKELIKQY